MKLQMKFSKILCLVVLIICAINFIFSLGILTDVYNLYIADNRKNIAGSEIYVNMQGFNTKIVRYCILMIVLSLTLFITQTNKRRNYYVTNYVSSAIVLGGNYAISIYGITQLLYYKNYFLTQTDFEKYKLKAEALNLKYTESTFWFDINIILFIVNIVITSLLIVNLIWKIQLMKKEKALLMAGETNE